MTTPHLFATTFVRRLQLPAAVIRSLAICCIVNLLSSRFISHVRGHQSMQSEEMSKQTVLVLRGYSWQLFCVATHTHTHTHSSTCPIWFWATCPAICHDILCVPTAMGSTSHRVSHTVNHVSKQEHTRALHLQSCSQIVVDVRRYRSIWFSRVAHNVSHRCQLLVPLYRVQVSDEGEARRGTVSHRGECVCVTIV